MIFRVGTPILSTHGSNYIIFLLRGSDIIVEGRKYSTLFLPRGKKMVSKCTICLEIQGESIGCEVADEISVVQAFKGALKKDEKLCFEYLQNCGTKIVDELYHQLERYKTKHEIRRSWETKFRSTRHKAVKNLLKKGLAPPSQRRIFLNSKRKKMRNTEPKMTRQKRNDPQGRANIHSPTP